MQWKPSTIIFLKIRILVVAIPAVFIIGMARGGFGGGLPSISTPMMALVIPPVTAAAITLPILIIADLIGIYLYRHLVKWSIIKTMIPGALLGIFIGWLTAAYVSTELIIILVGLLSIVFALLQILKDWLKHKPHQENYLQANFWGTLMGYTSFISHSGAPPFNAYVLGLKLDKLLYAGTNTMTFAILNAIKLVPYFMLGQFSAQNLIFSASLIPPTLLGVVFGLWAIHKVSQAFFYNVTYAAMIVIGMKLIWDGREAITTSF